MSTLRASLDTLRADIEVRNTSDLSVSQRIEFNAEISQTDRFIAHLNNNDDEKFYDDVRSYIVKVSASLSQYSRTKNYLALTNNGRDRTFVYNLEDSLKLAA